MMEHALAVATTVVPIAAETGARLEDTLDASASSGGPPAAIIAGMLAVGLGLAILAAYSLLRRRAQFGSPARVLSRAMGIGLPSRRLLGRVARRTGLPGAAAMLISRGCFDHCVKRFNPGRVEASRLASIRQRVFSE